MSTRSRSRFFALKRKGAALQRSSQKQDVVLVPKPSHSPETGSSTTQQALAASMKFKLRQFETPPSRPPPSSDDISLPCPAVSKRKITPLEEQIMDLKRQHPGMILMVECGYRYRFFGDDASEAAKVLDISSHQDGHGTGHFLTASVPTLSGPDRYIRKLVAAGHKVGVVEQTETSAEKKVTSTCGSKAPFNRELAAVYSSSTLIGGDLQLRSDDGSDASSLVLALLEDGKGGISMTGIRPMTGDVFFDRFPDDKSGSLLEQRLVILQPREIVIPAATTRRICERLHLFLRDRDVAGRLEEADFSGIEQELVDRIMDAAMESKCRHLSQLWAGLPIDLCKCFSALFRYLKCFGIEKSLIYSNNISEFAQNELLKDRLRLPALTVRNIELFEACTSPHARSRGSMAKGSLYSILNRTTTKFGSRMLRDWLSSPLVEKEEIEKRLDAVQYFVLNPRLCKQLCDTMRGLPDLELSLMATLNLKIRALDLVKMLSLIHGVSEKIPRVWEAEAFEHVPLAAQDLVSLVTRSFESARDILHELNVDEAKSERKERILKDWSRFPDVCEIMKEIEMLEDALEKHKKSICRRLGLMMFNYSSVSGLDYLIEVKQKDAGSVPESWSKISSTKQVVRFRSEFINETVPKLQYAKERLEAACRKAWMTFLDVNVEAFREMAVGVRALARLDCFLSMAKTSSQEGFCRPVFNSGERVAIENGRNIVVESTVAGHPDKQYVTNDVLFGCRARGLILTGPNMGGKSCYIRQVAMCALLAQTGFYVPSSKAELPVFDGIYLRIGARDDIWSGRSTLMVELDETAFIMRNVTKKSLVLLDEVGRGTSTHDGTAIAKAVLDYLVDAHCYFVFVTHYKSLTNGRCIDTGLARNGHMGYQTVDDGDDDDPEVLFLYKLCEGPCSSSFGLNVARMSGLPDSILKEASLRALAYERLADT